MDSLKSVVHVWAKDQSKDIDALQLGRCMDTRETEKEVDAELAKGKDIQIEATPTVFINGRRISDALPWERLKATIDNEIEYQKVAKNAGEDCGCEVKHLDVPGLAEAGNSLAYQSSANQFRVARRLFRKRCIMKSWKRAFGPVLFCAWLALGADARIDPNLYLNDVKYLASPALKGRATEVSPEPGNRRRIPPRRKYREFGIHPAEGKNYLQSFPVTTEAKLGPQNHFAFTDNGHSTVLHDSRDYVPFSFSSPGKFSGTVVFVGYGITAPEFHYDDYAGLDVKGKVVLVLRHEPQENVEHRKFGGRSLTVHSQFADKAADAKIHGAAGMILIEDRPHHPDEPWELVKFGSVGGPQDAGLAVVEVDKEAAGGWLVQGSWQESP